MSEVAPSGATKPEMAHMKKQKITFPMIHGKPNLQVNSKIRLSNHQRNMSLDFR